MHVEGIKSWPGRTIHFSGHLVVGSKCMSSAAWNKAPGESDDFVTQCSQFVPHKQKHNLVNMHTRRTTKNTQNKRLDFEFFGIVRNKPLCTGTGSSMERLLLPVAKTELQQNVAHWHGRNPERTFGVQAPLQQNMTINLKSVSSYTCVLKYFQYCTFHRSNANK